MYGGDDEQTGPPPLPDWPAQLRAQGRSITWLAGQTGRDPDVPLRTSPRVGSRHRPSSPNGSRSRCMAQPPIGSRQCATTPRSVPDGVDVRQQAERLAASIRAALGEPIPDDRGKRKRVPAREVMYTGPCGYGRASSTGSETGWCGCARHGRSSGARSSRRSCSGPRSCGTCGHVARSGAATGGMRLPQACGSRPGCGR